MAQNLEAGVDTAASTFADRLADAVDAKRSQLLVGLDPRPELLPVELRGETYLSRGAAADACARFCRGLIDAVSPYVVGVKLQVAFFEALGSDGLRAYEEVCDYARAATLLVVADGKRGDIGSTARAYADAYLEAGEDGRLPVDALTVNPYLGSDSVEPLIAACRRSGAGIFCLVKTSNAGSADIQDLALSDGRRVWQQVAELVNEWGSGLLGERGTLERRRRRRCDLSARGGGGAAADAAGDSPLPGDRRPGRDPRRRGARVHERAGERARAGLARGHLRVPRRRGGLA
jgi:orotidine-5'-phosphate decarboxylase